MGSWVQSPEDLPDAFRDGFLLSILQELSPLEAESSTSRVGKGEHEEDTNQNIEVSLYSSCLPPMYESSDASTIQQGRPKMRIHRFLREICDLYEMRKINDEMFVMVEHVLETSTWCSSAKRENLVISSNLTASLTRVTANSRITNILRLIHYYHRTLLLSSNVTNYSTRASRRTQVHQTGSSNKSSRLEIRDARYVIVWNRFIYKCHSNI